jgi:hypothetical protein
VDEQTRTIYFRAPGPLSFRLQQIADTEQNSISAVVRRLLALGLEHQNHELTPSPNGAGRAQRSGNSRA